MFEDTRTPEQREADRQNRLARIKHLTECVGMPLDKAEIVEDLGNHAVMKAIDSVDVVARTALHDLCDVVKLIALQMLQYNIGAALNEMRTTALMEGIRNGTIVFAKPDDRGSEAGPDSVH